MVKKSTSTKRDRSKLLSGMEIDASKSQELQLRELTRSVQEYGLDSRAGRVGVAGRGADGTTRVGFYVDGSDWISEWPEWAFALAQLALVNNLRLWVISNGLPFGFNLHQVFLLPNG